MTPAPAPRTPLACLYHWEKTRPDAIHLTQPIGGGKVIGQSDKNGGEPNSQPHDPGHLISTILRTVIDPGQLRLLSGIPQEITQLLDHAPIEGLGA